MSEEETKKKELAKAQGSARLAAWNEFSRMRRAQLKISNPGMEYMEMNKMLGEEWRAIVKPPSIESKMQAFHIDEDSDSEK